MINNHPDPNNTKSILSTLCYIKINGKTLMMKRNKRKNDVHFGKWNGLGGKLISGESIEECIRREVKEESGLLINSLIFKGILTFPSFIVDEDWYVFIFIAYEFEGTPFAESHEGELHWIEDSKLLKLNLWDGDKIFIPWLDQPKFFSGKFEYQNGHLHNFDVVFY